MTELKFDQREIEQLFLPIQKRYLNKRQEILDMGLNDPDLDLKPLLETCEKEFTKETQEAFVGYVQKMGDKFEIPQEEIDKAIKNNMPGATKIEWGWSVLIPTLLFIVLQSSPKAHGSLDPG